MVHRLAFRQGMVLTAAGLAIGRAFGLPGGRVLGSLLDEGPPTDPVTFAGVSLLLVLVGAGAVLVPSVRAARLEPMIALRSD